MLGKLLGIVRAPFLVLVPASLSPAFAVAWHETGNLPVTNSILIIVAALAGHIAVNALNEYDDFRSGLDFTTLKTPFSGGSGTLIKDPAFAPVALFVGWLGVLTTLTIGLFFLWKVGNGVLLPGLVGLAVIVSYNRWINQLPLLCLLAPGLGFGLLMVNLSVLVLTGSISDLSLCVSLPVTLLTSNLLLVNQLPDVEADKRAGRRHLPIVWGEKLASRVSLALLASCYLVIISCWLAGFAPSGVLLALLTLPVAVFVAKKVLSFHPEKIEPLVPVMAANVGLTLLTPVLVAIGIIL